MTYDGHLVVAAQNGLLVLNRALTTIEDSYPLPSDQILTNSICIDENGGVYVASNSRTPGGKGLMQKLICKDGKSPPPRLMVHGKPITTVVRKHHVSNSDMALVQRLHLWALAKTRTSW